MLNLCCDAPFNCPNSIWLFPFFTQNLPTTYQKNTKLDGYRTGIKRVSGSFTAFK